MMPWGSQWLPIIRLSNKWRDFQCVWQPDSLTIISDPPLICQPRGGHLEATQALRWKRAKMQALHPSDLLLPIQDGSLLLDPLAHGSLLGLGHSQCFLCPALRTPPTVGFYVSSAFFVRCWEFPRHWAVLHAQYLCISWRVWFSCGVCCCALTYFLYAVISSFVK